LITIQTVRSTALAIRGEETAIASDLYSKVSGVLPGVVAVLVIAGGLAFGRHGSLDLLRPAGDPQRREHSATAQNVEARMWQDPFLAIEAYALEREGSRKGPQSVHPCRSDRPTAHCPQALAIDLARTAAQKDVRMLVVMVNGESYAEAQEGRRRMRYAVLSGLNVGRYVPRDPQHIGFFKLTPALLGKSVRHAHHVDVDLRYFVPYEWLDREVQPDLEDPTPQSSALVVWFNTDALRKYPLEQLGRLVRLLKRETASGGCAAQNLERSGCEAMLKRISYSVIGPLFSDDLKDMLTEVAAYYQHKKVVKHCSSTASQTARRADADAYEAIGQLRDVRFYSDSATLSSTRLLADICPGSKDQSERKSVCDSASEPPQDPLDTFLAGGPLNLTRTILPDDQVLCALVRELVKRDRGSVLPLKEFISEHMVLLSEWDDSYGRGLPATLIEKLAYAEESSAERASSARLRNCLRAVDGNQSVGPCPVLIYSYLHGLDGVLPPRQPASSTTGEGSTTKSVTDRPLDYAEGNRQFDYLRRLASTIKEDYKNARTSDSGVLGDPYGIRYVGILGTDVYDKLLLLKALRPEFPGAVFFTTDLDARMLHPSQYEFTRNLVVASSFGLSLRPELQGDVPPFRSSYQTATFLSTLAALPARDHPEVSGGPQLGGIYPRIFEIGRDGAVDLSAERSTPKACLTNSSAGGRTCSADMVLSPCSCVPIHAKRAGDPLTEIIRGAALAAGATLLAGLLMLAASATLRTRLGWRWTSVLVTSTSLIVAAVVAYVQFQWLVENGEPATFSDGISVWPSELLALGAGVILIWFLRAKVLTYTEEIRKLTKSLLPVFEDRFWQRVRGFRAKRLKEQLRTIWREQIGERRALAGEEAWMDYCVLGSGRASAIRVSALSLIVLLAIGGLLWTTGLPNLPGRGPAAFWVNTLITGVNLLAFVWVLCYVFDTTRLCDRWIRATLTDGLTWDMSTVESAKAASGLAGGPLDEWITLQLIAKRTAQIAGYIYWPAAALVLIMLARGRTFADWNLPPGLFALAVGVVIAVLTSAASLQFRASQTRQRLLGRLAPERIKALRPGTGQRAEQIAAFMEQIKGMDSGAFKPLLEQPYVLALLVPSAVLSGIQLAEYLLRSQP